MSLFHSARAITFESEPVKAIVRKIEAMILDVAKQGLMGFSFYESDIGIDVNAAYDPLERSVFEYLRSEGLSVRLHVGSYKESYGNLYSLEWDTERDRSELCIIPPGGFNAD